MTCGIVRPDPAALFKRIEARFSTEVLGGSPIIPETNEFYVVALNYALYEEFYSVADQLRQELDPKTACCENLYALAARDGVYPKPATGAQGYATFTGTPGTNLPPYLGAVLQDRNYQTVSKLPLKMPASGSITARIRSSTTGAASNLFTGSDLTGRLSNAVTGLDATVKVNGGALCGGTDAEDCETFRERYLDRLKFKPRLRQSDVEDLILSWPCVTRISRRGGTCCVPSTDGSSTCTNSLHYYAYFDDTFPGGYAPQCVVDDMNLALFGATPGAGEGEVDIGVCGEIHTATGIGITVTLRGLECYGKTKKTLLEERIGDLFRLLPASETLDIAVVNATVLQVYGPTARFESEIIPASTAHCTVTSCGSIDFDCDYGPLLTCVSFIETDTGGCA